MKDFTEELDSETMTLKTHEQIKGTPIDSKGSKYSALKDEEEDAPVNTYVKFSRPYKFEDETHEGIDMGCLDNLTSYDLGEIEKKFYKQGVASFNPENTATYAKITAQKASGLPIEFFEQLPIKDMLKIKSRVVNFFYA